MIRLTQEVDADALGAVVEMGFDEQRARFALAAVGPAEAQTADAAVRWLLARAGEELQPALLGGRGLGICSLLFASALLHQGREAS